MRPVKRGPRPHSPVNEEISSFLPGLSTKIHQQDQTVHDPQTPPETGSEPVSLGSNPSSPVFQFALQIQGFSFLAAAGIGFPKNARGYAGAMRGSDSTARTNSRSAGRRSTAPPDRHLARPDRRRTFARAGRRGRPLVPTARTADQPAGAIHGLSEGIPAPPTASCQTFREPA